MFRAFFGELGHLALDYTRVDSIAARLDPLLDQLRQQQIIPLVQTLWCGAVALRQPRLQDLQATRERQPVDIEILPLGRLQHQCSYHEVAKRQGEQLLLYTLRRLAAQVRGLGRAPGILVRLLLVNDKFLIITGFGETTKCSDEAGGSSVMLRASVVHRECSTGRTPCQPPIIRPRASVGRRRSASPALRSSMSRSSITRSSFAGCWINRSKPRPNSSRRRSGGATA